MGHFLQWKLASHLKEARGAKVDPSILLVLFLAPSTTTGARAAKVGRENFVTQASHKAANAENHAHAPAVNR